MLYVSTNALAQKSGKIIRRWVAKDTAIGPREKGGLNNIDWPDHAAGFQAEWMIRYLQPGEAAWKQILDQFILYDKKGKMRYPEGRGILLMNLSDAQKTAIITSIPKGAEYMRACIREFWKLRIRPHRDGRCRNGVSLARMALQGKYDQCDEILCKERAASNATD